METYSKIITFIKDLQYLFAGLGISSVVVLNNIEKSLELSEKYNLHLVLFFIFFSFVLHRIQKKQIKDIETRIEYLTNKTAKDNLKVAVKQLAKDLSTVEEITFEHTIKYILDLEERRKELELNSYTQATLEDLIGRIK